MVDDRSEQPARAPMVKVIPASSADEAAMRSLSSSQDDTAPSFLHHRQEEDGNCSIRFMMMIIMTIKRRIHYYIRRHPCRHFYVSGPNKVTWTKYRVWQDRVQY